MFTYTVIGKSYNVSQNNEGKKKISKTSMIYTVGPRDLVAIGSRLIGAHGGLSFSEKTSLVHYMTPSWQCLPYSTYSRALHATNLRLDG